MSSHHFVKEGQEPALIIANGEACSYELLVSIREWCPYTVVLDGAYERVLSLGIVPDVVIGDMDSIGNYAPTENTAFIKLDNQENTDLEKALDFLVEKGYADINVLWATGKRLDHTLNNFASLAKYPNCKIVLHDDYSRAFVLPRNFSKYYEKGTSLSLIPLHTGIGISTQNLRYPLCSETLEYASRSGTSNAVVANGIVHISHTAGILVLIESVD